MSSIIIRYLGLELSNFASVRIKHQDEAPLLRASKSERRSAVTRADELPLPASQSFTSEL